METWLIVVLGGYMLSTSLALLTVYMERKKNGFTSVGDLTVAGMCFITGPFVVVVLLLVAIFGLLNFAFEQGDKKVF